MDSRILEVITYLAIIWIASSLTSPAAEITVTDMEIVSATLILEAGGEYVKGAMEAVNEVIYNRSIARKLARWEVCLQPKQFSCWNSGDILPLLAKAKRHPRWSEAMRIATSDITSYTAGADHYHADYCSPSWASALTQTTKIGRHVFYK